MAEVAMGVFSRSWTLTKLTFGVIRQDKEMLLFPLLAGVFSLLYGAVLLYPTIIVQLVGSAEGSLVLDALELAALFATYFGLAFIATFFNVCVVYTAKTRFAGGDATFMQSVRFALSRIHLIAAWSLVAASVGILLRVLDQLAERLGLIGKVVIGLLSWLLGAMWSLVTLFVIPVMVYEEVGPLDAIKRSTQTLRDTWGESLVRHVGLGLVQLLFLGLGVGLGVVLSMLLFPLGGAGVVAAVAITGVYFLAVILVFAVADNVYSAALYAYANGRPLPADFDHETLRLAFRQRA
jgi:hypothetical protein